MALKLWDKGIATDEMVQEFTIGKDKEMDIFLAKYDVLGTIAHVKMLETINILNKSEVDALIPALRYIYTTIEKGSFIIEPGVEDVHSQIEHLLTLELGDIGKKVHSGRSRNDQVLVDMKLYLRNETQEITHLITRLFKVLITQSEAYKQVLIPGYTHLQIAMPSSFGLWFGAYAESLCDDIELLQAAYNIVNQNPLGSAAGYGSSFPLNRTLTAELLGFETLNYNVVYAQMTRGKSEQSLAFALASIAGTLSRMAMDMCLYNSQNFGFVSFPDQFTTGSSIMPHKKNPDVWELVRGKCNLIKSLPNQIMLLQSNLPSGYHRELQLLKEQIIPAIQSMKSCLELSTLMLENIIIKNQILNDSKYDYIFSVEAINQLVLSGVPFRDAYKQIGQQIEAGNFKPEHTAAHTHEGSIGNLCNDKITKKFEKKIHHFNFNVVDNALNQLLDS